MIAKSQFQNVAYIALGSNLNNPLNQVVNAVKTIDEHQKINVLKCSSWYKNPALELPGKQSIKQHSDKKAQEDYINGVIKVNTSLSAIHLLDTLQAIELDQGREHFPERWQSRTLDLDIALYNNETIKSERLIIPHSQLAFRAFVIYPLFEIEPDLTLPCGQTIKSLTHQVSNKALEKMNHSG